MREKETDCRNNRDPLPETTHRQAAIVAFRTTTPGELQEAPLSLLVTVDSVARLREDDASSRTQAQARGLPFADVVRVHQASSSVRLHVMMRKIVLAIVFLLALSPRVSWADAHSEAKTQVSFGIAVAQRGLWEEARYRFERAAAIDSQYAEAYNNLAIAYEQLGLVEKARQAYEKALALDPGDTLIRQNYELYEEIHARARSEDRR